MTDDLFDNTVDCDLYPTLEKKVVHTACAMMKTADTGVFIAEENIGVTRRYGSGGR